MGLGFIDVLKEFEKDPATEVVVLVGRLWQCGRGVPRFIAAHMSKPVVAYIAGKVPSRKRMGHAGLLSKGRGTFAVKSKLCMAVVAELP